MPSPVVLMMRPRHLAIAGSRVRAEWSSGGRACPLRRPPSDGCSQRRRRQEPPRAGARHCGFPLDQRSVWPTGEPEINLLKAARSPSPKQVQSSIGGQHDFAACIWSLNNSSGGGNIQIRQGRWFSFFPRQGPNSAARSRAPRRGPSIRSGARRQDPPPSQRGNTHRRGGNRAKSGRRGNEGLRRGPAAARSRRA